MKSLITSILLITAITGSAQNQDCTDAKQLVTKDSLTVESIIGHGDRQEAIENTCSPIPEIENNSNWYQFEVYQSGNFNFTIKPKDKTHDYDFFLFRTISGSCEELEVVRCNTSSCLGMKGYTGIASDDEDTYENFNCDAGENAYCSEVHLEKGEQYYLLVNNFTWTDGYSLHLCGTAKLGPSDTICTSEILNIKEGARKSIAIYPNPSNGQINLANSAEIERLEIYNVTGNNLFSTQRPNESLKLDIPAGTYIVKTELKNKGVIFERLVIQHN